jgi:hypothetical protein
MNLGRLMRRMGMLLLGFSCSAQAVDHIDIQIGRLEYSGAVVEKLAASLDMQGRWQGQATLSNGDLAKMAELAKLPVKVTQGAVSGKAQFAGESQALNRVRLQAEVHDASFSDAEGLHAGEKVGGHLTLDASRVADRWAWSGQVDWNTGEVFWQPLYFAQGGVTFQGRGAYSDTAFSIEQATLGIAQVGEATLACELRLPDSTLQSLHAEARHLDLANAYAQLAKPYLEKTLLSRLEIAGHTDLSLTVQDAHLQAFDIALDSVDLADQDHRFALYKLNAHIPWSLAQPTQAVLTYDGGELLSMPLGTTSLAAKLDGYSLTSPNMTLPILDGALTLNDVSAAFLQQQWYWHLGASVSPISMADFSHAVGWPAMQGKVAASIPMVTYADGRLTADGAMGMDVFDGSILVTGLSLQNPLGQAPRLNADIQMRNLDLQLLTQTYSFGAMTGRLDGDIAGLELSRWQPVKFDANFHSSAGHYPRKISQRAVENISALGGAGAAAAIQRSFLRFFKEFNYEKLGLSCKLRQGVCSMNGVEPVQSGYVIVKGSGIPAITVLGYNRSVSWGELLSRIQRVTAGNAAPIIK